MDNEQSRGFTVNIPSISDFAGSIWAKILAILTIISIVMGIIIEFQSLMTGYYTLQKASIDAEGASINITSARAIGKYPP